MIRPHSTKSYSAVPPQLGPSNFNKAQASDTHQYMIRTGPKSPLGKLSASNARALLS